MTSENATSTLDPQHLLFVDKYFELTFNGTKAAIAAGYSKKTARQQASRLLKHAGISKAIASRIKSTPEHAVYKRPKACYVYLIRAENGLVKIGKSADISARFETLNIASPVDLELIASLPSLFASLLENGLHEQYASKRVKGEWFALSDADIEDIINRHG